MPKHALITGGSRGIGLAIAQLLARNNYQCSLIGRSAARLSEAVSSLPTNSHSGTLAHRTIAGDISAPDFWERDNMSVQGLDKGSKKIDVLVNCAGVAQERLFKRVSEEEIKQIVDTNLTGMMLGTRFLLRRRENREDKPGQVIINVSSLLGLKGGRGAVAYAASKAGVLGFTRALAAEVGPLGIRVNAIVPGYIETDMTEHLQKSSDLISQIPLKRFGTPEEVADAAWFLINNQYANNCVLNLDGGLSAV
ncbi:hypothetical protein BDV96DRAFT_485120 [Lophiotrema nucula]|uniref:Ketoreductase domain-containing protein n=1 Tax=Lophiotrema nucula TaxID=690887 RepID=A0A6A5ZPE8_9PLEO|nr:hypothetical protein BDV96DRAFT_485120 [Lophiotrema nucula]